jgi:siroheme synthase (precorrin-2 oxidase/ferrochelatase)
MGKSKKRGGAKAHRKRVQARTNKLKADQKWAEDFMKNYQVNQDLVNQLQQQQKLQGPQGSTMQLTGGDNK